MSKNPSALTELKRIAYRVPISAAEGPAIEEEFTGESDRGCVLIMSAIIERILQSAIRKVLRANISENDLSEIFRAEGPLGSFSSRISVAYALGMLGKNAKHDLHLIRHIRNAFAHSRRSLRFTTPAVHDVCMLFVLPKGFPGGKPDFSHFPRQIRERYPTWDEANARLRFEIACHILGDTISGGDFRPANSVPVMEIIS